MINVCLKFAQGIPLHANVIDSNDGSPTCAAWRLCKMKLDNTAHLDAIRGTADVETVRKLSSSDVRAAPDREPDNYIGASPDRDPENAFLEVVRQVSYKY
jgi:hypothetical protein